LVWEKKSKKKKKKSKFRRRKKLKFRKLQLFFLLGAASEILNHETHIYTLYSEAAPTLYSPTAAIV
jgi:hypothetical protein